MKNMNSLSSPSYPTSEWASWESQMSTPTPSYNQDSFGESFASPELAYVSPESEKIGERLKKVVSSLGSKALEVVMNKLPNFGGNKDMLQNAATNLYENSGQATVAYQGVSEAWTNRGSYAEQAVGYAKEVGQEVAGAGIIAAKESVMKYYGLEKDENEKLRVARKLKFGKAVVKTLANPIGTASSVGTRAGYAARKVSVRSAKGQLSSAKEAARNWQPQPTPSPDAWANNW